MEVFANYALLSLFDIAIISFSLTELVIKFKAPKLVLMVQNRTKIDFWVGLLVNYMRKHLRYWK